MQTVQCAERTSLEQTVTEAELHYFPINNNICLLRANKCYDRKSKIASSVVDPDQYPVDP
jgi:hypothetical protein